MSKAIPFVLNSALFIIGIVALILNIPYLCAACLLAMSLIFVWNYGLVPEKYEEEGEDEEENDSRRYEEMSGQISELSDKNSTLEADNDKLRKEVENLTNRESEHPQPYYICPLTSSLPVNLNTFFSMMVHDYEKNFGDKGIYLEYNCQEQEAQTYLSESALNIICINIFDNILKFTPENERVYIRITKRDEDCLIIFKNPGGGIRENEMEKIFEINYQGSNHKGGNGLGLAQVKAIVDDFGGSVWGKSTPDRGFALYLQIPEHQKGTTV
jgi:signal transduction histidine kinase